MLSKAWNDLLIKNLFRFAASFSILIVALIFLFLFREALPFIRQPGLGALLDTRWEPISFVQERFGLVPLFTASLLITVLATLLAVPLGLVSAVYISEIASPGEREFFKPFVELMASIPSVVLGFFGIVVLSPLIKRVFQLDSGLTALSGALLLALMAIPTIISISEDALKSVPSTYKQASLALGASRLETLWLVTVPAALSGIIAAVMLGMGRVIGETMTVLMVTGNAPILTFNPLESVRTMTATIAAEMGEVEFGSSHYQALFWVGIVLLLATFGLNLIAQRVLKRYQRR
jgi:phosphate transport system permease protein